MVYKSGQIFLPFCHNTRVWQTDRQTDRQTEFSSQYRVCITCSAVKTKRSVHSSTQASAKYCNLMHMKVIANLRGKAHRDRRLKHNATIHHTIRPPLIEVIAGALNSVFSSGFHIVPFSTLPPPLPLPFLISLPLLSLITRPLKSRYMGAGGAL